MISTERKNGANIYDVAASAGVSKSTVSRVLNGSGRVSPHAMQQVMQAIDALGYRPNPDARRLAGSVDRRIGLVLPFFQSMFSSFFVHEVLRGAGEIASERDADLLLHIQGDAESQSRLERRLRRSNKLGGWLIADDRVPDEVLSHLVRDGTPFIVLNRDMGPLGMASASVDNAAGARLAVEHLIALGHRRIATITGDLEREPGARRLDGYLAALESAGIALNETLVASANFQRDLAAEAAGRFLAMNDRPTAVFAASDLMAAGVYDAAAASGVAIPEELSVIGFDDDVMARQLHPTLTTVRQPLAEMARAASAWLLNTLEGGEGALCREVLLPELVGRCSCSPPGE